MVNYVKNNYGDIAGFIEWAFVNQQGQVAANGQYLWINDVYICPKYRNDNRKKIKILIKRVLKETDRQCHTVYWVRDKYSGRKSQYPIKKFKEIVA